jgi:uncharacterized protein
MTALSLCPGKNRRVAGIVAACMLALLWPGEAEANEVFWSDLPDATRQNFEDPYRDLTYDQLDSLRVIAQLRNRLEGQDVPAKAVSDLERKLSAALAIWKSVEVDPYWLISQRWIVAEQRERAGTAGNPALDGVMATLSGFVIPAPPDEEGRFVAYLVPERGMCSHMPPPPPNQLLRLVFEKAWYPQFIYEPIQVSGRLEIEPAQRTIRVVDGPVNMASTFRLDVASVAPLTSRANSTGDRKPWPIRPQWNGSQSGQNIP